VSTSSITTPLAVSIGVITHQRTQSLDKLLNYLKPAIESYSGLCELIIVNNSGPPGRAAVEAVVNASRISDACPVVVADSPMNNIATGRNQVVELVNSPLLVFIDDDEYPTANWLTSMVDALHEWQCDMVAGPIYPVFPDAAPAWVKEIDLHNSRGLKSGDRIDFAASGNFIADMRIFADESFDEAFGRTGGEDTEFFLRSQERGFVMRWCEYARVYEDIPPARATSRYMIRRFVAQGANYRRIMHRRGRTGPMPLFLLRALLVAAVSLPLAALFIVYRPRQAAYWMKRGFSNLGKLALLRQTQYG